MKGNLKRMLSVLLALTLVVSLAPVQYAQAEVVQPTAEGHGDVIESGMCGETATYTLYSDRTLIISGSGAIDYQLQEVMESVSSAKEIVVEEGITEIGDQVFCDCINLTSVELPDSLEVVGMEAFNHCSALAEITLPENLKKIGTSAFKNCYSLESIVIPDSVTEYGEEIFRICYNLKSITLPDTMTSIPNNMFGSCENLTSIEIPVDVTQIGESAFSGCIRLTSIEIPASVTQIGKNAFYNCYSLTSIEIPAGVTELPEDVFYSCSSLTEIVLPEQLETIGEYVFTYCEGLNSIIIPDSVTSIGTQAFKYCKSLTSIVIPDSVTSIGTEAFEKCENLESIRLPEALASIGDSTFVGCSKLSDITIYNKNCEIGENAIPSTVTIYGCCGSTASAYAESNSGNFVMLEDSEHNYGEWETESLATCTEDGLRFRVCVDCSKRNEEVVEAAHSFGDWNVETEPTCTETGLLIRSCIGCSEREEEEIPKLEHPWKTEYTIDKEPTAATTGQKSIHCSVCGAINESSIVEIGKLLGTGKCGTNLTWTVDADGVMTISGYGKMNEYTVMPTEENVVTDDRPWVSIKEKITKVIISDDVMELSQHTFSHLPALESIEVAEDNGYYYSVDGVLYKKITDYTSKLIHYPAAKVQDSYTVPSEVVEIVNYAFCYTSGLRELIIPESVTQIGNEIFYLYTEIESLNILSNALNEENYRFVVVFGYLEGLKEIHVADYHSYFTDIDGILYSKDKEDLLYCPSKKAGIVNVLAGVKMIDYQAFYYCTEVTAVNLPDSLTSIGMGAFLECTKLKEITLGANVSYVDEFAFSWSYFTNINVVADNPYYSSENGVLFNKNKTKLVYCPREKTGTYRIPSTVKQIGDFAFNRCAKLTAIEFAKPVDSIGMSAFYGCEGLTSLNIPEGLLVLDDSAFDGCSKLTTLVIPKSVKQVGNDVLNACSSELVISGHTNSMAEKIANEYGHDFKSIGKVDPVIIWSGASGSASWELDMTGTLTVSGTGNVPAIFSYDDACGGDVSKYIHKIVVKRGITSLSENAFGGFPKLRQLYLPDTVTYIGTDAFGWVEEYDENYNTYQAPNKNLTVYVNQGSQAQVYAINNNLNYEVMDKNTCPLHSYKEVNDSSLEAGLKKLGCDYCKHSYNEKLTVSAVAFKPDYASTSSTVTLSWNGNSAAVGYEIYIYDSTFKTYKTYKTITSNSTTGYTVTGLSAGKSYMFKIRAYGTCNNKNYYSSYSTIKTVVTKPATVNYKTSYSATTSTITLEWSKVSSATGYELYKYDSASKGYKVFKTITSNKTTNYKVSKLKSGTSYKYRIRTYKTVDGKKYYSDYSSILTAATNPSKAVISSVKSPKSKELKVVWKKTTGASGYQVQVSTKKSFKSSKKDTKSYNTTSTNKKITSLKKNTNYYVRVRAYKTVNGKKQYGAWSGVKSIKTK